MSENLTSEEIDGVVEFNRTEIERYGGVFEITEVDENYLYNTLPRMIDSHNHIQDRRTRIVKKATEIMSGITYDQPFFDANKRTALTATVLFLEKYGFTLPMHSFHFQLEIHELLNKVVVRPVGDPLIFSDVEKYIENVIFSLTS